MEVYAAIRRLLKMPLPQLETRGIDITNTLARIDAMKTSKLQREGLVQQNAMRALQLTPEAQERSAESARLDSETKNMVLQNERMKSQQLKYQTMREGIKNSVDQIIAGDNGAAYTKNREYIIKEIGLPEHFLPSIDFFTDDKVDIRKPGLDQKVRRFNKERFVTWANKAMLTIAEISTANTKKKKDFKLSPIFNAKGEKSFVVVDQTKATKAEDFGSGMSFTEPDVPDKPKVKTTYQTRTGEIITQMTDNKFYASSGKEVKGSKVKNLSIVGTRAEGVLTPVQEQIKKTQGRKRLTKLSKDISKIEKDGSTLLLDKDAGADAVAEYNSVAEETGGKYRYEWRENAIEVEESLTNKALEFFGLSEDESMTDGYVKVSVEEFGKPQVEIEEVKEFKKPATTMDENLLKQYKRKYPNRTEEEIIKAYNKLT